MAPVFRQYDISGLEREYLPAHWPGVQVEFIINRWIEASEQFHRRANVRSNLRYGENERQSCDLFPSQAENAPVLVFIHGGYWRNKLLDKRSYSFCIEPIVEAGAVVAMVEYDLCPNVSMDTLVGQVREACGWVYRHCAEHGGDPARIHVAGHSAGGHITAMMAATDWASVGDDLPDDMIKSIVPISGLFDLQPLLYIEAINVDLRLDMQAAKRNSPATLAPKYPMPVSVVVGMAESSEFRRQSRELARAWEGRSSRIEYQEMAGHDHFGVIEAMTEPGNLLTSTIRRHLGLQ